MKKRGIFFFVLAAYTFISLFSAVCFDSDYGKYYESSGFIQIDNIRVAEDNCFTDTLLKEYYCYNDTNGTINYTFEYHDCLYGCSNGICNSGFCNDSDGGKDYYVKGFAESRVNNRTYADICYPEEKKIFEYYCRKDGTVGGEWFSCENGCKDGVCLTENNLCPILGNDILSNLYDIKNSGKTVILKEGDSINIGDYFIFGRNVAFLFKLNNFNESSINFYDAVKEENYSFLINKNNLQELSIGEEKFTIKMIDSKTIQLNWMPYDEIDGFKCKSCSDSDEGKNFFLKGSVLANGKNYEDACYDNNKKVNEYFCNEDKSYGVESHDCSYGCKDGACVNPGVTGKVVIENKGFFSKIAGFFRNLF